MTKNRTNDMTKGNPFKLIILFSIPLFLGNTFQQLYNMADTVIVGRFVGVKALAALGATGSLFFLLFGLVSGLTSGFAVITSQKFGAGDYKGMRHSITTSIFLCIFSTVVITVFTLIITKPLLHIMNTPEDIFDQAVLYISIIFAGTAASVLYNMIACILRALGDSRTPLYFLLLSSAINIVLDLVFIISFSMGVDGAAYATVISQAVSGILCFIYIKIKYPVLKLHKEDWHFDFSFALDHLKVALPMSLQFCVTALGIMTIQAALNRFGSTVVASYTAASKVEQIITTPAMTFGMTMAIYCGQNFGAGQYERIKTGVRSCILISGIFSIVSTILVILFSSDFTRLFIENASSEVIKYSVDYLNLASLFFFFLSVLFIYRNALQGMGNGFVPMMAGVCEFVARTAVAFTLPSIIGYLGILSLIHIFCK